MFTDLQQLHKTFFFLFNSLQFSSQKENSSFLANGMFTDLQQLHNKQTRILQQMDNQQQLPDTKFTKGLLF
jgi:hypothetical protein